MTNQEEIFSKFSSNLKVAISLHALSKVLRDNFILLPCDERSYFYEANSLKKCLYDIASDLEICTLQEALPALRTIYSCLRDCLLILTETLQNLSQSKTSSTFPYEKLITGKLARIPSLIATCIELFENVVKQLHKTQKKIGELESNVKNTTDRSRVPSNMVNATPVSTSHRPVQEYPRRNYGLLEIFMCCPKRRQPASPNEGTPIVRQPATSLSGTMTLYGDDLEPKSLKDYLMRIEKVKTQLGEESELWINMTTNIQNVNCDYLFSAFLNILQSIQKGSPPKEVNKKAILSGADAILSLKMAILILIELDEKLVLPALESATKNFKSYEIDERQQPGPLDAEVEVAKIVNREMARLEQENSKVVETVKLLLQQL